MTQRRGTRLEKLAAFFRGKHQPPAPQRAALLLAPQRFTTAQTLVSAFYAVLAFFAISDLFLWPQLLNTTTLTPRWPVYWLHFVDLRAGILGILCFHLLAGFLGVLLPQWRSVRILVFLSVLEYFAFRFSFGSIGHGEHLGVLLAFVLIFLPDGWRNLETTPATRRTRVATLLVFSTCQGMILLIYSMSGVWKVGGLVEQLLKGEVSYLHPTGLAQQIASKLLSADAATLLGPWFIEHPWVGWPLMLGAIYLEFFALWVLFRPRLHAPWGWALIVLHIFTHLTMGVGFPRNTLWLALFLVFSPFRPQSLTVSSLLRRLPGNVFIRNA
jgi:hypothetical protein